jgi:AcrR family transcriptional regulator
VPKVWTDTVASHRREVREAILDAAGALLARRGLLAFRMSQLADAAEIGRATLYKYFADVEEVLAAWHARQIAGHLVELRARAEGEGDAAVRLRSVLTLYSRICWQRSRHGEEGMAAVLHGRPEVQQRERELRDMLTAVIAEAAASGVVRGDVPAEELAGFCVHALGAAGEVGTSAGAGRLVEVVWTGLTAGASSRKAGTHR